MLVDAFMALRKSNKSTSDCCLIAAADLVESLKNSMAIVASLFRYWVKLWSTLPPEAWPPARMGDLTHDTQAKKNKSTSDRCMNATADIVEDLYSQRAIAIYKVARAWASRNSRLLGTQQISPFIPLLRNLIWKVIEFILIYMNLY